LEWSVTFRAHRLQNAEYLSLDILSIRADEETELDLARLKVQSQSQNLVHLSAHHWRLGNSSPRPA
jgi:hypothetical protein